MPLATALLLKPGAVAMALRVVVLPTGIAPLYTVEAVWKEAQPRSVQS